MNIKELIAQLEQSPDTVEFDDVIAAIDAHFNFTPTPFRNGDLFNAACQNTGSSKILSFGLLHDLSDQQTLACFGKYYREDVLGNPDGDDHANIRNFMNYGWGGVSFEGEALTAK